MAIVNTDNNDIVFTLLSHHKPNAISDRFSSITNFGTEKMHNTQKGLLVLWPNS